MPAPPPWRYRCYASVGEAGRDEIKAWFERQSKECRTKFQSRLLVLRGLPAEEWKPGLFRWLRGDGQGLGEVRFKADRLQQRPLGFRGPESDMFTLVFPATEKGSKFVPRTALEIAQRLKAEIEANKEHSVECWLFPDPEPDVPPGIDGQ